LYININSPAVGKFVIPEGLGLYFKELPRMLFSKLFVPTLKETPQEAEIVSHQLMLRAGMIRKLASGVYSYLPLGFKVLKKIENIIRREMNAAGGQELLLPTLHPRQLWEETGRWNEYGKEMLKVVDRHEREFGLGPTHEEIITDLVRKEVKSYRQLPLLLYQFQTKFRDEIRPRFGVMRGREFMMKDAYSFDRDENGLGEVYKTMYEVYRKIFVACGLRFKVVEADPGLIGGSFSHEYMVLADTGEEELKSCQKCDHAVKAKAEHNQTECPKCQGKFVSVRGIEVGHIFKLGTKYSSIMKAGFLDENGSQTPFVMGCYGIGVSRIIAAAIEQSYDKDGIIWQLPIAPFAVLVLPVNVKDEQVTKVAGEIYEQLKKEKIDVLMDDRNEQVGVKFKDADLIGVPVRITVGSKGIKENKVEIKARREEKGVEVPINEAVNRVKMLMENLK
jgi:prolyl-tRNA synthetase